MLRVRVVAIVVVHVIGVACTGPSPDGRYEADTRTRSAARRGPPFRRRRRATDAAAADGQRRDGREGAGQPLRPARRLPSRDHFVYPGASRHPRAAPVIPAARGSHLRTSCSSQRLARLGGMQTIYPGVPHSPSPEISFTPTRGAVRLLSFQLSQRHARRVERHSVYPSVQRDSEGECQEFCVRNLHVPRHEHEAASEHLSGEYGERQGRSGLAFGYSLRVREFRRARLSDVRWCAILLAMPCSCGWSSSRTGG